MNHELVFRAIVITLFISGLSVGVYYRRKAAQSGEKLSRQEEGLPIFIALRLFGFAAWISILVYIVYPPWMQWSTLQIPTVLRWFGVILGAVSVPLFYWVFSSLGKNVTDTVVTRKRHTLVTSGPYRWVRHPLYAVWILSWIGFTLLAANWFFMLMIILVFTVLLIRTPIEEAKLIEKFGDEYCGYMRHTGRFLPHLNIIRSLRKRFAVDV